MNDLYLSKSKANQLRKDGKYEEALPLYKELWETGKDPYDGTGYLACLRKLKRFNEAVPLAYSLQTSFPDFQWCQREFVWTCIQGQLKLLPSETSLQSLIEIASIILNAQPDILAKKLTIFKVVKQAKKKNDWKCVSEWLDKLKPSDLSNEPMKLENGREGWSDQEQWYYDKIKCHLGNREAEKAIEMIDAIEGRYPKHSKFFVRLKAISFRLLNRNSESLLIYQSLCKRGKQDWWLYYEYGKVLQNMHQENKALAEFYHAAVLCREAEMGVKLFEELGALCVKMNLKLEGYLHFQLSKLVREKHEWKISEELLVAIKDLEKDIDCLCLPNTSGGYYRACKSIWTKKLENTDSLGKQSDRHDLKGKISISNDRPLSFINTRDGLSAICFAADLPNDLKNGDIVLFDTIPSYDKKKERDSWQAKNIRKVK